MKKLFKKAFIPHEENDFAPHLFREAGVAVVFLLTVFLLGSSILARNFINSDSQLGAVYPAVIVALTNQDRAGVSLPSLTTNSLLEQAAQFKAEDMLNKGYFAHISPAGVTPWYWIKQTGYSYDYAGENLAINYSDSADVTDAWMRSPGHRANLLNDKFTEVGVATVKGNVDGREVIFVVQMFGTPKSKAVVSVSESAVTPTKVAVANDKKVATNSSVVATSAPSTTIPTPVSEKTLTVRTVASSSVLGISTSSDKIASEEVERPIVENAALITLAQPSKILRLSYFVLLILIALLFILFLRYAKTHQTSHIYYGIFIIVWLIICVLLAYSFTAPAVVVGML